MQHGNRRFERIVFLPCVQQSSFPYVIAKEWFQSSEHGIGEFNGGRNLLTSSPA